MNPVLIPLLVMAVFLVLMGVLLGAAVRRSRRGGFDWDETDD